MKAIQLKAYGSPVEYTDVVEINDIGPIKNDEVIIEILYSPVNPSDLLLANGTYPIHPELPSVGEPIIVSQLDLIFKRITIHGFFMYLPAYLPKLKNAKLQSLKLLEQGKINVPIAEIYPPERVKEALQHTINGAKVLLQFNS